MLSKGREPTGNELIEGLYSVIRKRRTEEEKDAAQSETWTGMSQSEVWSTLDSFFASEQAEEFMDSVNELKIGQQTRLSEWYWERDKIKNLKHEIENLFAVVKRLAKNQYEITWSPYGVKHILK